MPSTTEKDNTMENLFRLFSLLSLFAVTLMLFPYGAQAQSEWVYVNDNREATGTNNVYGFQNSSGLIPIAGTPWATGGTSVVHNATLPDQTMYSDYGITCLYVGEPLASGGYPKGDIAAFRVHTATGKLTLVDRYATPAGISIYWGIALTTKIKVPTLFAGYSGDGSDVITSWEINLNNCKLTYKHKLAVFPLNGGAINGMAESFDGTTLVATYGDGSIESFETPNNFTIVAAPCATAIDSTGYTDGNSGLPLAVDITEDSKYAILGDQTGFSPPYGPTELETVKLPIPASCPGNYTTDFGGTIVASGSNLGTYEDAANVRLSPNENFIYVTNNGPDGPQGLTTVAYNETLNTTSLAAGCSLGYSNPTPLINPGTGFFEPNGMQTSATTGNGSQLYVGEYRSNAPPSAVGLVDIDPAGCTEEATGSPFTNPDGQGGASQVSAWPKRPF